MSGQDDMIAASRAKGASPRRQGASTLKPQGAALTVGSPGSLTDIPHQSTPAPVGAAQAIGDGTGHMTDWADREHPLPQP